VDRDPSAAERRNILVVNVGSNEFTKIAPLLERSHFDVDRFPRAGSALELLSLVPFNVLIAGYPLPDIDAQEFLDAVRSSRCPSRRSPVLLLTPEAQLDEATVFIGRGANRVVAVEKPGEELQRNISELLAVSPRRDVRAMVRMGVSLSSGKALEMGQTVNISRTGMLLVTEQQYPLGTNLSFEFHVDDDGRPIRGQAEVVRHTTPDRESSSGIGIRFTDLDRDSEQRLYQYLEKLET
jgi:CheY-like chemotaxis protein